MGQDEEDESKAVYRIHLSMHVLEGGREETRNYSLLMKEEEEGKIRALRKILVPGVENGYLETGFRADIQYDIEGSLLDIDTEIAFSSLGTKPVPGMDTPPLQEWQCRVETRIIPGETTVLGQADPTSKEPGYRLEIRAVKVR
jgi:hypothetical protein